MKRFCLSLLLGLLVLTPSCISFRLSAEDDPSIKASGIGTAYAGYCGFDEWDGSIIKLGLFGGEGRPGEFFSLDIWPFGGIGLGVAGARVKVLPFEIGAGALLYHPKLQKPEFGPDIVDETDEEVEEEIDEEEEVHEDEKAEEKPEAEEKHEAEEEKKEHEPKKGK